MANITVSPTRMELTRLKGKLRTAQRGHKLLKDKRDELMKQFLDTVREVRSLRAEVEEDLMRVHKSFTVASALVSSEALEQALLYPKQSVELTRTTQNIMSVNVPVYDFQTKTKSDSDIYPYGFAATSGELDDAVEALGLVFRKMLKLAQIEKSAQLMAEEIEKTRRRVNALEYVKIPQMEEAIQYILSAVEKAGYKPGEDFKIAIDAASSEWWDEEQKCYVQPKSGKKLTQQQLVNMWKKFADNYPIISLEDGMAETDWEGWAMLTKAIGDKVQLVGFGTFETAKRAAREGRNPQTGKTVKIAASVVPKFKAGKALKDIVNK